MFTGIEIENYKSLKVINLKTEKNTQPKKVVAIYGENGAGKSNLISAFMNLSLSLRTVEQQKKWSKLQTRIDTDTILSEDETSIELPNSMLSFIKASGIGDQNLSQIFKNNTYLFGANEPMRIRYTFKINNHTGFYELIFKLSNEKELYLASEELNYLIKKSSGTLFKIETKNHANIRHYWSPSLFKTSEVTKLLDDSVERQWGKHTFLAILKNFTSENNRNYIEKNILSNLLRVLFEFSHIAFRTDHAIGVNGFNRLLINLSQGHLLENEVNTEKIKITEQSLNKYFVPLYSEINSVNYQTKIVNNQLSYQLFVNKQSNGKTIMLPFDLESNGTKKLLDLFPLFLNAVHGETVIVDEIDQGIHDLLIDRLIDNLKDDIEGQLIFTTHDTQVMKQLDVSSLYVIQTDVDGNKRVVNLSKASKDNIAAHNNVQKMYLNGYFSGIPYADDVNFYDIVHDLGTSDDE